MKNSLKIHKELDNKKTTQLKLDISPKKKYKWPISTRKDAHIIIYQGNANQNLKEIPISRPLAWLGPSLNNNKLTVEKDV